VISVVRRVGDKVRVAPGARGARTGTKVQGWDGIVVDHAQEHLAIDATEQYFVRFDVHSLTVFFDWLPATALLDR
jgi:hypothetical protein